jgi:hypothetical protein
MRKKGLGKLYGRLRPEERFRLVIEAKARGDEGEFSQLVQSTPRYACEKADPAYTGLMRVSKDLTCTVCLRMLPSLAKMRVARAFAEILPLASSAFAMDVQAKEFVDVARTFELENAKEARTLWEAFGNFCRDELGTQPKKLVVMWFEVALPELEELEALPGDVEPEREEVEKQKALIKEGWQTLMKG